MCPPPQSFAPLMVAFRPVGPWVSAAALAKAENRPAAAIPIEVAPVLHRREWRVCLELETLLMRKLMQTKL
jgi:hypothetical protein